MSICVSIYVSLYICVSLALSSSLNSYSSLALLIVVGLLAALTRRPVVLLFVHLECLLLSVILESTTAATIVATGAPARSPRAALLKVQKS